MRWPERPSLLATVLICAWCAGAWAAEAPPDRRLKELESELEKGRAAQEKLRQRSQALAAEIATLGKEMVAAARAMQEHEETLSEIEAQLAELRAAETETSETLDRRRQQTTGVLTALQRLAWRPSEALIAQPASPAETVRSAILLRAALPQIEGSAKALRDELAQLSSLRAEIARKRGKLAATAERLEDERDRLKRLAARKSQLMERTEAETRTTERRLQATAAEAQDLRDLLLRLEEERKRREAEAIARAAADKAARAAAKMPAPAKRDDERPFSQAQGDLPYPARGSIVVQYGQPTEVGLTSKGITIETRNGAQVIAPYDGQVAFAGPFRGYGLLLIIEHGEGYHTLLAGMARIDGIVGQRVLAGEPVGVMGQSEGKPALYLELRRNGQPVNPLPWLTARKDKVSG